jgi:hypothetical protein
MFHTDYRTLIDRGRKAGLNTSDLYTSIAARPPEANELTGGQADENGFVAGYNQKGQRIYRPGSNRPPS